MVKAFEEGEVYRNPKLSNDVMVYAIASEDDNEIVMAVGWVDRASEEMSSTGELVVKKADLKDWEALPDERD